MVFVGRIYQKVRFLTLRLIFIEFISFSCIYFAGFSTRHIRNIYVNVTVLKFHIFSLSFAFMQLFLKILSVMANNVDPDQTAPLGSGSAVFVYASLSDSLMYEAGSSKYAHAWISFKLHTLFAQVPATMKIDLFSRTKKCGSQESSLMYTCHKCIPVSKPTSIKSTIEHDV